MFGRGNRRVYAGSALILLVAVVLSPGTASAGFFDFLFGGFARQPSAPAPAQPPAKKSAPDIDSPSSSGRQSSRIGGGLGPATSLCVRTCDGRYFPIQRNATAQPQQICSALCPAAKTKVFYGADVANATAPDGTRYEDLDNAFVYREKLVDGCTCNGRTPYGLATIGAADDPTLRPGDLIATTNGLVKATAPKATVARSSDEDVTSALPSGLRGYVSQDDETQPRRRRHGRRDPFSFLNAAQ
jgi:hypothetical protein